MVCACVRVCSDDLQCAARCQIIDSATSAATSPDCTGTVDADGKHGVGRGTPPCTAMVSFHREQDDEAEEEEEESSE